MGIAQDDMQWVRRKVGEVVGGKLFKGAHERSPVIGRFNGEAVRLPLVCARNDVQQYAQQQFEGTEQQGEQNQAGVHR